MSDLDAYIVRSQRRLEKFDEFMARVEPLLKRFEQFLDAAEKERATAADQNQK